MLADEAKNVDKNGPVLHFAILQRLKKIEAGVDTHFDRISTLRLQ